MACFVIESNFEDVGFGDPEIDFSTNPYSLSFIDATTAGAYANLGFGSPEDITIELSNNIENTHVNYFDLNFSDSDFVYNINPTILSELTSVKLIPKIYKDIIISTPGETIVNFPTGFFDSKPTVICQNYIHDSSFHIKNVNKNQFIVVNPSEFSQRVAYIANGIKREIV